MLLHPAIVLSTLVSTSAVRPPHYAKAGRRQYCVKMGLFDDLFGKNEEAEALKDQQMREQMEILNRRRNPAARRQYTDELSKRRNAANKDAIDKIAWQRSTDGVDPLVEFKRRKEEGRVNGIGYEDEPTGGIPMPMASFGVGGEFGVGGKYDNGERFDLRLPYAEQGWTEENDAADGVESVDFFANLLSGGKLQREADERRRQTQAKRDGEQ